MTDAESQPELEAKLPEILARDRDRQDEKEEQSLLVDTRKVVWTATVDA